MKKIGAIVSYYMKVVSKKSLTSGFIFCLSQTAFSMNLSSPGVSSLPPPWMRFYWLWILLSVVFLLLSLILLIVLYIRRMKANMQKREDDYFHKLSIAIDAANMIYWHYDIPTDLFTIQIMVTEKDPTTGKEHKLLEKQNHFSLEDGLLGVHIHCREEVGDSYIN